MHQSHKWRPVVYRDLQIPGPLDAPFTGIWADMIDRNNRRYAAAGDGRYAVGNAPLSRSIEAWRQGRKVPASQQRSGVGACDFLGAVLRPYSFRMLEDIFFSYAVAVELSLERLKVIFCAALLAHFTWALLGETLSLFL